MIYPGFIRKGDCEVVAIAHEGPRSKMSTSRCDNGIGGVRCRDILGKLID